jgi:1,5-anhydro-D-fructose reductase (1,5-anhydro-D-mannitol-forming)
MAGKWLRGAAAVRWGIVGCGDVTEIKSGPGFQKADGSALVAVMRRNRGKAEDYARRHGVARAYGDAAALIADPEVDAIYIATPPDSHASLALDVASAGKPCLVEKPMARNHAECVRMVEAFAAAGVPLWVAYYRRALPRFLRIKEQLETGAVGRPTSVRVQVTDRLARGADAANWRFDPAIAGAGLFLDLASHGVDLLDFLFGPITEAHGVALNTGGSYAAEDVTNAVFRFGNQLSGSGTWNFNADAKTDTLTIAGSEGTIVSPIFSDTDLVVSRAGVEERWPVRNPPHVHQPLIQTIVNELRGHGTCPSTAESGARASWVMDRCLGR